MISLDLARKLKEAGFKPECLDCELFWLAEVEEIMHVTGYEPEGEDVWIPRLDQLLAEIEQREYIYGIGTIYSGNDRHYYCHVAMNFCRHEEFMGKSPEDAAAEALLWILETGGRRSNSVYL